MTMNEKYRVLGVMSGTSLDGIDFAICTFSKNLQWEFRIEKSETIKYSEVWRKKLANIHAKSKAFISKVDIEYGEFLGEQINIFLENEKIDFIGSPSWTSLVYWTQECFQL